MYRILRLDDVLKEGENYSTPSFSLFPILNWSNRIVQTPHVCSIHDHRYSGAKFIENTGRSKQETAPSEQNIDFQQSN